MYSNLLTNTTFACAYFAHAYHMITLTLTEHINLQKAYMKIYVPGYVQNNLNLNPDLNYLPSCCIIPFSYAYTVLLCLYKA